MLSSPTYKLASGGLEKDNLTKMVQLGYARARMYTQTET